MKKQKQTLYKFFSSSKKWTKGQLARNKRGDMVMPDSTAAVRWCLLGACQKIGLDEVKTARMLEKAVESEGIWWGMEAWNDKKRLTFRKFRAVLKKAKV